MQGGRKEGGSGGKARREGEGRGRWGGVRREELGEEEEGGGERRERRWKGSNRGEGEEWRGEGESKGTRGGGQGRGNQRQNHTPPQNTTRVFLFRTLLQFLAFHFPYEVPRGKTQKLRRRVNCRVLLILSSSKVLAP